MGLPSWAYAGAGESEWEDKGIFLRNRKTGEIRPKGISGGLPAYAKVTPESEWEAAKRDVEENNLDSQVAARANQGIVGLLNLPSAAEDLRERLRRQGLPAVVEELTGADFSGAPTERPRIDAPLFDIDQGARPPAALALEARQRQERAGGPRPTLLADFALDQPHPSPKDLLKVVPDEISGPVAAQYEDARDRLAGRSVERGQSPYLMATADALLDLGSDPTNLIPLGAGGKALRAVERGAEVAAREGAEAAGRRITSFASRVLPGEDISERFASFLRGKGIEDPDLYHDLSEAAQKALDREFLAADAGPQGASWGRFLERQGLRPDDYAALPGLERARLEGDFRKLLPETRQKPPGRAISAAPEAIPTSDIDRAAGGVATPGRMVVARRLDDGSVRLGTPGQIHADLLDPGEWPVDEVMGFAYPGGPFLTREAAAAELRKATSLSSVSRPGELDAADLQEVLSGGKGAGEWAEEARLDAIDDELDALANASAAQAATVPYLSGRRPLTWPQRVKVGGQALHDVPTLDSMGIKQGEPGLGVSLRYEGGAEKVEEIAYRLPDGRPAGAAILHTMPDGRVTVTSFAVDRGSGLVRGRAAAEIAREIARRGALDFGSLTEDSARLIRAGMARAAKEDPIVAQHLEKIGRLYPNLRKGRAVNPEAGYIRLGPGGPPDPPPDPVLAGFHSEVFGREAKATAGEKLEALGNRLQREMVEAYTPLLKVARRFGPAAEDEIEVAIQRTRSASHTQMNPVLRFTEEYDPLANGGRGDWIKTGDPLTAVTGKLSPSERVEVESILAAGSQAEFAARKEAAVAQRTADRAANTAERNMLRLLGQEQRRELRGLSYEARALRAEELAATARGQRTLGRLDVLNRVSREGRRAGMDLPATSARDEAAHWNAGLEAEGAGAAAKDTEGALRRGIGDLSRDELRRYRERLAIVRPPDLPDLRLDIDPVRTLQAREVMRHAEETGLLKRYEEVLGQASIDRSGPGNGYRGWADRAWLRPAVGAGFITEADRVAMLQKNQAYSLFQQIDTLARQKGVDMAAGEVPNAPRFLKNAPPSVIHGVRKSPLETRMAGLQEGRQIAPVLEASAIQAARFQRLVDRQLVKNKLAELVEQSPDLAPEIVKTTDPMAPGSFVAFKGGEKTYLQAPPDLLENLDRLTAKQAAFALEVAQKATGSLRVAATTYTPGFPFGNLARDAQRGWITSQHGMLPGESYYTLGKEIVHRLFHRFEPSAMWREFDEGVASYSTYVKADSDGVNRAMQEAAQAVSGSPSARRIVDLVNPIAWLRELGQFKEAATRVTEKALARRGGRGWFRGQANPAHIDPETGGVRPRTRTESDLDAGKVSLNFMSGGSATREANRYYAFLNAQALDAADFYRQVTGPRKFTVIAKATAGITLPALYEVWHYRNDPEYRNLPWWDRSMFWHLGKMGDEIPQGSEVMADGYIRTPTGEILPPRSFWDGTWRRIPRPPGLFNLVFGILPSLAFEAVLDSNPKAGEEAVAGLVEQTPMQYFLDYDEPTGNLNANLFPMVPDALRPPLEAGTNLKGFPFGQAIDPRGTEEADPALRWNEQTPLWARSLSERSAPGAYHGAVSPNRIQRVVEGYTAGAGKAAGGLVDRALAGRQDPNGDPYADTQDPLTPRDVPFLRSFMGSPAQGPGSAPVKEFWARYDTARQSMDVLEGWEKAGRLDQARKAMEAHPELRYKSDLESTAKRLREMGKERKEILAAPFHVLGPEQKRAYLELVDQGMTQVAGQLLLYIQQQELARQQGSAN